MEIPCRPAQHPLPCLHPLRPPPAAAAGPCVSAALGLLPHSTSPLDARQHTLSHITRHLPPLRRLRGLEHAAPCQCTRWSQLGAPPKHSATRLRYPSETPRCRLIGLEYAAPSPLYQMARNGDIDAALSFCLAANDSSRLASLVLSCCCWRRAACPAWRRLAASRGPDPALSSFGQVLGSELPKSPQVQLQDADLLTAEEVSKLRGGASEFASAFGPG